MFSLKAVPKRGNEDVNTEMERKVHQTAHYRHRSGNCKAALLGSTRGKVSQQHWLRCSQNHAHICFYCKDRPAVKTLLL